MILLQIAVLLLSFCIDVLAVLFTRAVQDRMLWIGTLITSIMAVAQFVPMIFVIEDHRLMIGAVIGHALGFNVAMRIPLKSRKADPNN